MSGGGRSDLASSWKLVDAQRELAAAGAQRGAVDADQVAEVERESRSKRSVAEHVDARVQLDLAGAVDEVEERRLAGAAARGEPPGDAVALVGLLAGRQVLVGGAGRPRSARRRRTRSGNALGLGLAQPLRLRPPLGDQLGQAVPGCRPGRSPRRSSLALIAGEPT